MKRIAIFSTVLLTLLAAACGGKSSDNDKEMEGFVEGVDSTEVVEPVYLYGIDTTPYIVSNDSVRKGDTAGAILNRYGVSSRKVYTLEQKADSIFPLRKIRDDRMYTTFIRTEEDSTGIHEILDYMVYHISNTEYATCAFVGDSVSVTRSAVPVRIERRCTNAEITSSLWGAIMKADLPYALADELECYRSSLI